MAEKQIIKSQCQIDAILCDASSASDMAVAVSKELERELIKKMLSVLCDGKEHIVKLSDTQYEELHNVLTYAATRKLIHAELVRCKECKHRPVIYKSGFIEGPQVEVYVEDGDYSYESTDDTCPYLCDDSFYNRRPLDDDYCSKGERSE